MGDTSHTVTSMSRFGSAVLLDEAAGLTLRVRLRETGSIDVLCTQVAGGCQSTLVEPSVATPGP